MCSSDLVALAEAILEKIKASLKARAKLGPIPLPGGEELYALETHPRSLLLEKALPVLAARVSEARAEKLVEHKLPSEVVSKIARELTGGRGMKKGEGEIWTELEAAGAVRTTTTVSIRTRKKKAAANDAASAEPGATIPDEVA